jgi:hypothetical protein
VPHSFGINGGGGNFTDEGLEKLRHVTGRVHFNTYNDYYRKDNPPVFVAFHDESNPRSIYQVDENRFNSWFGPTVRLIGIDLEVTTAPLTNLLRSRLPWLKLKYAIPWETFEPGKMPPLSQWPLNRKISYNDFFANGSR